MTINREDIEATLARARKTVKQARALVAEADLRIQETDRFLAQQGLTREQVMAMRFTPEQRALANEELKRHGLEPLPDEPGTVEDYQAASPMRPQTSSADETETVDNRQRKFGTFMQQFRI